MADPKKPWEMEWQTAAPSSDQKPWEMEWQGSPASGTAGAPKQQNLGPLGELGRGGLEGIKWLFDPTKGLGGFGKQPPIQKIEGPPVTNYHPSLGNFLGNIKSGFESFLKPFEENPTYEIGRQIPAIVAGGWSPSGEAITSGAGTAYRTAKGAVKGAIAEPKPPLPAQSIASTTGGVLGELIGGPKGAAIGAGAAEGLLNLPAITRGAIKGGRQGYLESQPISPLNRVPIWQNVPPPQGTSGLPDINPIVPTTTRRTPPSAVRPPATQSPATPAPVTVPSEALPSRDWRFEDARDMARLLNQHGLNPADMGADEWKIAAPALQRNLGIPNDRAAQLVQQEWNKLQTRGQ